MKEYDDDEAIAFIRKYIGVEVSNQYSDDEILEIIDIIYDYYERKGFTKLNRKMTDDELLNEEDLTSYVKKTIKEEGIFLMDPDDVETIVKAELEYEESLEDA